MAKIVVAYGFGLAEEALAVLKEAAQVTVLRNGSEEALLAELRDANTLLVSIRPAITRRFIESAPQLRHIARLGVGVDTVDLQAATERGIFVTNVPEVTSDSVAEFTMTMLLSLAKNIVRCDRAVKEGRWAERLELIHENIELSGKTHGIVGMGNIGRRVAIRCRAFGMRVLYYRRNRDLETERTAGVEYVPLDTLIRESDSISLHLPLTKETTNLIDKPRLESMKRTAFLINQARGKVVDEEALVWALKEGKIGGYATDVYASEPPDPKSELFRFKNVVTTPHLGGGTREARLRANMTVAEEALRIIRGEPPKNLVNREVLEKTTR